MQIVVDRPPAEGLCPFLRSVEPELVYAFLQYSADVAFGLAVRLRSVWSRLAQPDPKIFAGLPHDCRLKTGAVVCQDLLHIDPAICIESHSPADESFSCDGLFIREEFHIGAP